MYGIVYKATNKITGEVYIGATIKLLEHRKRQHIDESRRGNNRKFAVALREWKPNNFEWKILEVCKDRMELAIKESIWISKLHTISLGYNLHYSGNIPSEETRKKLSESHKGVKFTEETRKKMSKNSVGNKGRIFSKEIKKKMSESHKGVKLTEETKRKMSESAKRNWQEPEYRKPWRERYQTS